jgi:hypothetical protein
MEMIENSAEYVSRFMPISILIMAQFSDVVTEELTSG